MLALNFTPFPTLVSERLVLRKMNPEDAADLFVLRSDPEVMKYIPRPLAVVVNDVVPLIDGANDLAAQNEAINWGIVLKDENRVIGTIGFVRLSKEDHRAEVGYLLHPAFQGKGLVREALALLIDFGFKDLDFHTICAIADPDNLASIKLLERTGFSKEGHFREDCFFEGRFLDSVHYSLINPNHTGG